MADRADTLPPVPSPDDPHHLPATDTPLTPEGRHRSTVRTFTPRWRMSPLIEEQLTRLLPVYVVDAAPLDPVAVFGREAPLVLEIGSGHGAAAIAYAQAHPEHDLLAAEVHVPGVARMMARVEELGLTNLRVHRGDALEYLQGSVAPATLAGVHLFFPDPWPKARHAKRRLVQQDTLDLLADRLAPGGALLVATDHAVYAEHVREQLAAHGGYAVVEGERPPWRPSDGFEDKGVAAGRPIVEIRATPR